MVLKENISVLMRTILKKSCSVHLLQIILTIFINIIEYKLYAKFQLLVTKMYKNIETSDVRYALRCVFDKGNKKKYWQRF